MRYKVRLADACVRVSGGKSRKCRQSRLPRLAKPTQQKPSVTPRPHQAVEARKLEAKQDPRVARADSRPSICPRTPFAQSRSFRGATQKAERQNPPPPPAVAGPSAAGWQARPSAEPRKRPLRCGVVRPRATTLRSVGRSVGRSIGRKEGGDGSGCFSEAENHGGASVSLPASLARLSCGRHPSVPASPRQVSRPLRAASGREGARRWEGGREGFICLRACVCVGASTSQIKRERGLRW